MKARDERVSVVMHDTAISENVACARKQFDEFVA
jgi:hypothetical protein